jgi:asparagine synthase (glutamine-hydrolysing)
MSVQFGKCNFDGKTVDPKELEEVRPVLAPYGPDREGFICRGNVGFLYRAFCTTKESRREVQPCVTASGVILTWDGTLDNREELISSVGHEVSHNSTDIEIVSGAYERWGVASFAKLIGDWALSIWDARSRSLILAKDFVGSRHLYYSVEKDQVTWSTVLDLLVLRAPHPLKLEEEYIAGWLAFFPAAHLTPYVGIHSVPPSSFVRLAKGTKAVRKYWDFNPAKRILYRTDPEYEERFRTLFANSVRRRLRSDLPVLAELSGGMDSSSIVCMADEVMAQGKAVAPRLDTISYYNDAEPSWNERPYFTEVEEKRGRAGCHISVDMDTSCDFNFDEDHFAVVPATVRRLDRAANEFISCMTLGGNRVLLSGIGGDEITGGVPTPAPELANLFTRGRLSILRRQLRVWALQKRKPWLHLLYESLSEFLPVTLRGGPENRRPAPWLSAQFIQQNRRALQGYPVRLNLFGALPSFQDNLHSLGSLRRQLSCSHPYPLLELRYPYLDRDLLEFMFSIPREQVVRPHQRRSLMRRSLAGIVPDKVLNRKRKAFVVRGPMAAISERVPAFLHLTSDMMCTAMGVVDEMAFAEVLKSVDRGQEIPIMPLMRTVTLEHWLRHCLGRNLLQTPTSGPFPRRASATNMGHKLEFF